MHTGPKTTRELRTFGFAFSTAMTILGGLLTWKGRAPGPWVLGFAAVVLLTTLLAPAGLRPLEAFLGRVLRFIMATITFVVLTMVFFLVMTPLGLLMRLFGKETLGKGFDPEAETYWMPVESDGPATRPDKPY